jgi:asparagine synthase (glutamine-hydrolysing)
MCGIAGIIQFHGMPNMTALRAMTDALRHRGPDGEGFFCRDHVALGHRRLKVIDLTEAATQPMSDTSESIWITYNGEIYNYLALRDLLMSRGYSFRSRTDSETIPLGYLEWGTAFVNHLHGMFAFALYDARNRKLLLVRDRLGIKPLYFVRKPNFVAFASEPKAFAAAGIINPAPDVGAMIHYLQRGYSEPGQSMFEGVEELLPGHFAEVDARGQITMHRYWSLPEAATEVGRDPSQELRCLLEGVAVSHLQSDVPIGAHLSGGIDSSSVVGLLARHKAEPLHTFSIYFEEGPYYDERPYIEIVSRAFSTIHHYTVPHHQEIERVLPAVVKAVDGITAGPAVIPAYLLCKDIRAHGIIVTNGGQGGDEMFAGYPRHLVPYALAEIRRGSQGRRNALLALRKSGAKGLARLLGEKLLVPGDILLTTDARRLARPFRYELDFSTVFRRYLTSYLHCLLHIEDRTSMAWSLESRVPLLDDAVVTLAATMHPSWKLREGIPKRVLRDAVADLLPPAVALRTDKRGLPTPFGLWARGPLREYVAAVLTDPILTRFGMVNSTAIALLLRLHHAGVADFGALLWRPFWIGLWLQTLRDWNTAAPHNLTLGTLVKSGVHENT